jgi:MSHA biogenesis protein MshL
VRLRDVDALIEALSQQGTVRLLASPQVRAMNNQPALMRVGMQEVHFVTGPETDPSSGRAGPPTAHRSVTEGVALSVTAHISADGFIHMSVSPSVMARTGETRSRSGEIAPILSVHDADTSVRVREGETVVFAGLLQERTEPRPAGGMAGPSGAQEPRRRTTETVILLTPAIVVPGG